MHLGGLGDVCLAESIFLSLRKHFGNCLAALGSRRFLDLFSVYFAKTYGIESRHWLHLFSETLTGPDWRQIVFIGKDRQGLIRKRWAPYSREELLFIDMYPEGSFPDPEKPGTLPAENLHIEEYQLRQLRSFGIEPVKAGIIPKKDDRAILYPEKSLTKRKWVPENFIALRDLLMARKISTILLKPPDSDIPGEGIIINELLKLREFLFGGGIFVSNDSGMAHFAGACGLQTVTIFTEFDPVVWHPRGQNISLKMDVDDVSIEAVGKIVHGRLGLR